MKSFGRFESANRYSNSLHEQINRVFGDASERNGEESSLTTWAPAVDIF